MLKELNLIGEKVNLDLKYLMIFFPDSSLSYILTHKDVRVLFVGINIKIEDGMDENY